MRRDQARRRARLTVASAAVAALVFPMAFGSAPAAWGDEVPPASAEENPTTANLTAREKAQVKSKARALSMKIRNVSWTRDHNDGQRGFCSVTSDVFAETVDLWWKGRLDKDVAALVATARKNGIGVRVHPAEYTLRATLEGIGRLADPRSRDEEERAAMREMRADIQGGRPESDCSGLHLVILVPLAQRLLETSDTRAARVKRVGQQVAGIPILTVQERYKRSFSSNMPRHKNMLDEIPPLV